VEEFMTNTNSKQKRVAIYLRVSTDEQAKEGHYGLKVQEDRLRQFCASQGFELDEENVYRDEGYSGTLKVEMRPGLSALYEAAKEKQFDTLIVYKLDRLFRNQTKLLVALEQLLGYGVGFQSATQSFDTDTSSGRLMMQILGSFAEHERELIRERMTAGKLRAAKEGKWVTGVPPYGYRVDEKTQELVIQKEEAEVVKQFYEWLVYEKCSLREITRRAIKQNLPTPQHKPKRDGKRIGGTWYKRTINRILVNEVYTGQFYYNKYKRPFKYLDAVLDDEHQRPQEDHILITVPEIISQDMFEKSIQQLQDNRRFQKRNEKRVYFFAGLLYSGYSGKKLQSGFQKPKKDKTTPYLGKYYHVYIPALERIGTEYESGNPEGQCAESRLMPIWDTLLAILSDPKNVLPQLEDYTFKTSDEAKVKKELAQLEKQFETLGTKKQRIQEVYLDAQLDKDDYTNRMKQVRKDEKDLTIKKQKLSQMLLKKTEQKDRDKIIKSLYAKLQTKLHHLSYEEQQYILRLFVEKITLYHKKGYAEVAFKFPLNTKVPTSAPASVTEGKHMRLVLHVKILSEKERRQQIIKTVPAMCGTTTAI
jgi:site-specific DNA recombinase